MIPFLLWYVLVTVVGLAGFPLTYRMFSALPDRGYAFSRTVGLLVWGYAFWILNSLGLLMNNMGGLLFGLGVLLGLSVWAARGLQPDEMRSWMRGNRTVLISVEVLFLATFAGWTLVRAANPEIFGTEKPMELAFINAIQRSGSFPPNDPWLAGYAISYYYFGYVLTAMLAQVTGVTSGVAFNLGVALVFGLSAIGAYGMVANLLGAGRSKDRSQERTQPAGRIWPLALLGPFFGVIAGNLVGLLEVLHAWRVGWRTNGAGEWVSGFWTWLDIKDLSGPPAASLTWPPRYLWWWRASRVVQDFDLAGNWREIIDEFPFFSFLLADLHPHVLAIPFAFVAMGLALNLFLGGFAGGLKLSLLKLPLDRTAFIFTALCLGSLAFLNTWDFPMYIALFAGAYTLAQVRERGWAWARAADFIWLALALGLAGIILYLPFYIGFASQAGGLLPNLIYPTRGAHLWVMFGLFFVPLFAYLAYLWRRTGDRYRLGRGFMVAAAFTIGLFVLALLLGLAILSLPLLSGLGPEGAQGLSFTEIRTLYLNSLGAGQGAPDVFQQSLIRRVASPGAWITLLVLLGLTLGLIWPLKEPSSALENEKASVSPVTPFTLLLILTGTLLVLGPEFVFLRDQFGWRINTIFKFYYQAWLMWSIAAAFGLAVLLQQLRGAAGFATRILLFLILGVGLVYPVLGILDKTQGFRPPDGLRVDGTSHGIYLSADDQAAVEWLNRAPAGVLTEAVGGSYTNYARISAHSGIPTVLGWPGHESQWRGGAEEMGSREQDIRELYSTGSWREAAQIIEQYGIRYVYIGALERSTYGVSERKFQENMEPVFSQGQVTIYEVTQ